MSETINDLTLAFEVNGQTPAIRFLASLSDGRTVIQDDRPKQRNAWVRLKEWLKVNPNISLSNLRLQGKKGVDITMPPNQNGYVFGYKKGAVWGGPQDDYVAIGYYDGQKVNMAWYRQPNFDQSHTEERTVASAGFLLIRNTR